jgi:hypothetical protein
MGILSTRTMHEIDFDWGGLIHHLVRVLFYSLIVVY